MRLNSLVERWFSQSLARQFLLAGGFVSLVAMLLVGALVTRLIEEAVTRNSAASTALYVDSVIAPLLPDMRRTEALDDAVARALDETLGQGALGDRLISFRIWHRDGTILYADDPDLVGKRFAPSENLQAAFSGEMVAEFDRPEDPESQAEGRSGLPLLEIYNPILQPWSGEVVAVSEFYELATDFERSLNQARIRSWLAVALITSCFFLTLSLIVLRGSRIIDRQRQALKDRVSELSDLLAQNRTLHARVKRASQRAAALNESYLRRIGADLHDGPAQLVAFAALRLDSEALSLAASANKKLSAELSAIKSSLEEAMREIRNICNGLVLPHIEGADLPDMLARVVQAHEQRTGSKVRLKTSNAPRSMSPAAKICIFRFVQEALNNGYRHGGGIRQSVTQSRENGSIIIEVSDGGPGFHPDLIRPESIGLAGLRERVESLGGRFFVESAPGRGTRVRMSLNVEEMEHA
ncbi:sensor histidine kinase [Chelativorans sp.]|uniref:sensor histidine kinase n=1 Tax=Chelativorans sp. TaxID=2203393 RepID=UPI002811A835|nr:sensor histidine kinase [Chelativorans sp.]